MRIQQEVKLFKVFLIDIAFGFLAIMVITIFEFLVTLPFGEPTIDHSSSINLELLLTALPAALTTFVLAWLLKTKRISDSLRRAIIWTMMLALSYVVIGLGNNNFSEIFVTLGIYVLLVSALAGPLIYAKIKRLS
jgi:hypothetical protein